MNLQRIYESIKRDYESRGIEIDEGKLRQMAWMKRDRMMFESSSLLSSASSAVAGAGGGGGSGNRRVGQLLTETGLPLLTESGINIVIE